MDALVSIFPKIARASANSNGWANFLTQLDEILSPHEMWIATQLVEAESLENDDARDGDASRNVVRLSFDTRPNEIARVDEVGIEAGRASGWGRVSAEADTSDGDAPQFVLGTFSLPERSAALMVGLGGGASCDEDLLGQLSLTIREAFELQSRLNRLSILNDCAVQLLDGLPYGVLFVDSAGRILSENRAANSILNTANGLYVRNGQLFALAQEDSKSLKQAIVAAKQASDGSFETVTISETADAGSLVILLFADQSVTNPDSLEESVLLALIFDPELTPKIDPAVLTEVFGLTAGEARLASHLAQGIGAKDLPDVLNISPNTVKTHLRHIFRKTGTTGQSDFMRRLLSVPRLFG